MKIGLVKEEAPKKKCMKKRTLLGILAMIVVLLWGLVAAGKTAEDTKKPV